MLPGLEGVIGATSDELIRQFGKPRLDVYEGEARKLQFSGTACVLDIYLYPAAAGRDRRRLHHALMVHRLRQAFADGCIERTAGAL